MLDTLLKLLSFEEFKETKRIDSMSGFKETADGYIYEIYGGGRIYCNWQKEYENYCERRQAYIPCQNEQFRCCCERRQTAFP